MTGTPDTRRYRDFDAESEALKPVEFTLRGHEYSLPGEMPAKEILRLTRESQGMQEKDENNLTPAEQDEMMQQFNDMAHQLLSKETYESILDSGATLKQVKDLFTWVLEQYTDQIREPEESPNGKAEGGEGPT